MQCERLLKLAKTWYLSVKDETMAPARMISFMEKHAADCPVCQKDSDLHDEILKIAEIILPESKIPKAIRMQSESFDEDDEQDLDDEEQDDSSDDEEVEDVYDDEDDDFNDEPDLLKD